MLQPRLDTLPEPQLRLWPELAATPPGFILYGGTAIALRLGHRQSVDFDFFSFAPFTPGKLFGSIPYLRGSALLRSAPNTLTVRAERGGPVQLSYFGGLRIGQIDAPEPVAGPGFPVAGLRDLGGLMVAVVTQRAEAKDYLDIHALLRAGLALPEMLAAAAAVYEGEFGPLVSLKAIAYHDDPALAGLPDSLRRDLAAAVKAVDPGKLPEIKPLRPRRSPA